jgi:hypothetical protein
MTTKRAGGKITGLLALTVEAQVEVRIGDHVHLVGDYEIALADGTKPVLGYVSVSNIRGHGPDPRGGEWGRQYGLPIVPGDVTVEAPGFFVKSHAVGAAVVAGELVGINGDGDLVPAGVGVANVGLALTSADVAGERIDYLAR